MRLNMLFLRFFKPIFALTMLTMMCSAHSTKRDTLEKIKRILVDFERIIDTPENTVISKDYRKLTKRQFTNNYPCKEVKEELSVADMMRSKLSLSNYGVGELKYFPSTVVTFKCSSPEDFRFNQCQGLPCQCKQRYRQVYFQARHTNNCRNWKLIPLTINDGCHCENILK